MITKDKISEFIISQLKTICKSDPQTFSENTPLIGEQRSIKSVELVELLLGLEEYVEDNLNVKFDWSGDSAMSERKSILKSVDTLSEHIFELQSK
jgi:acyl carrier protein|tara:strand:+ start:759 stop:1043 length:285 start_codon:yes stop_codon:yes gene_type:complete